MGDERLSGKGATGTTGFNQCVVTERVRPTVDERGLR